MTDRSRARSDRTSRTTRPIGHERIPRHTMIRNPGPEKADEHRYEELHIPDNFRNMQNQGGRQVMVVEPVRRNNAKKTTWCGNTVKWAVIVIMGLVIIALAVTLIFILLKGDSNGGVTTAIREQPSGACCRTPLLNTKDNLPLTLGGGTVTVECEPGMTLTGGLTKYTATCNRGTWDVTDSCAFVDCEDVYTQGHRTSGVYRISPNGQRQMDAYCELELDGGGWTVFQRRQNGKVNFFRFWIEYKNGFGDPNIEYWLGNDIIHALTAGRGQQLKIEMLHPVKGLFYVNYSVFWIEDESNQYSLHVSGFSSELLSGEDSLAWHNGAPFSTRDRDTEMQSSGPCVRQYYGGWWYKSVHCHGVNLNGLYDDLPGYQHTKIFWEGLTDPNESLTAVRMMVKTAENSL